MPIENRIFTIYVEDDNGEEVPIEIEYSYCPACQDSMNLPINNEHIVIENVFISGRNKIEKFLPEEARLVEMAWEDWSGD